MNLTGFFLPSHYSRFSVKNTTKNNLSLCTIYSIYDRPTFTHRTSLLSFDVTSRLHITIIIISSTCILFNTTDFVLLALFMFYFFHQFFFFIFWHMIFLILLGQQNVIGPINLFSDLNLFRIDTKVFIKTNNVCFLSHSIKCLKGDKVLFSLKFFFIFINADDVGRIIISEDHSTI